MYIPTPRTYLKNIHKAEPPDISYLDEHHKIVTPSVSMALSSPLFNILNFVAASAAKAKLYALFLNAKETKILGIKLHKIGHTQPPTPIHCNNSTAEGITNSTIKRERSRSMKMRHFYICDLFKNKDVQVLCHPGQ